MKNRYRRYGAVIIDSQTGDVWRCASIETAESMLPNMEQHGIERLTQVQG